MLTWAVITVMLVATPASLHAMGVRPDMHSTKAVELNLSLRDLWLDHAFWTRGYALAASLSGTGSEAAAASDSMAVANAREIAELMSPYLGEESSDRLFKLLAAHYGGFKEYLAAAISAETEATEKARQNFKENTRELADFLGAAVPGLPIEHSQALFDNNAELHLSQADALAAGEYAKEALIWDEVKGSMYALADATASAVVKKERRDVLR